MAVLGDGSAWDRYSMVYLSEAMVNNDFSAIHAASPDNYYKYNEIVGYVGDTVKDIESIDKIKNRYNKIIWFSDAKIDKNRKEINEFIQFNKEPISKSESYYKKNKDVNPNEYIKFQHTDSVRNNWRK